MRRIACCPAVLLSMLLAASCALLAQRPEAVIRTQVNLVNVLFSVFDRKGEHIKGLTSNDLEVYEDDVKQSIEFFRYEGDVQAQSLTIVLLMDTSGSVKDKLDLERSIAMDFFRQALRPSKDLAAVIDFGSEVTLAQDFTDDLERLDSALGSLRAGGNTTLYDAVYLAAEDKLKTEAGRKVLLIVSDGEDTSSRIRRKEAVDAAQKNDVTVFAIGVKSTFRSNFDALEELARETGGRFFNPQNDVREMTDAFHRILGTLKQQYSVSYYSTNQKKDGTFRRIQIRVRKAKARVQHRSGYYAPRS